jgi:hypothetical protein
MLGAMAAQIVLGIVTVMHGAPWQLAIAHQLLAVVLWVLILRARFLALSRARNRRGARHERLCRTDGPQRQTEALAQVMGRLGWDQETMMPRGAAAQRAEEMAALEAVLHARRTDPRIGDWLEAAEAPDAAGRGALRQIRALRPRGCGAGARWPPRSRGSPRCAGRLGRGAGARRCRRISCRCWPRSWRCGARRRRRWPGAAMTPMTRCSTITSRARRRRRDRGDVRPDAPAAGGAARPRCWGAPPAGAQGRVPARGAAAAGARLAEAFGYDFTRGRLDLAVHPFSSGSGRMCASPRGSRPTRSTASIRPSTRSAMPPTSRTSTRPTADAAGAGRVDGRA